MERAARQAARLHEAAAAGGGSGAPLDAAPRITRVWAALDDDLALPSVINELVILADEICHAAAHAQAVSAAQSHLQQISAVLGLTLR